MTNGAYLKSALIIVAFQGCHITYNNKKLSLSWQYI
jgi:hypothetical protein